MSGQFSIEGTAAVEPVAPAVRALTVRAAMSEGRLQVAFALPSAGPGRLEVADVSGRMLRSIEVGAFGAGAHTIDLGGSELRSGVYFLRLTQGGSRVQARVALVK